LDHQQLKAFVIEKIEDLKGRDIVDLDVAEKSSVTETMLVCSGNSKRHVVSIADRETGDWVLVDLGDVIVHVMQDEARDFYQLEKLWS
jgi:ribosome-associated protein